MKKYELTDETLIIRGTTLHRIKACRSFMGVRKGDLGGFVESENNLSHTDDCWIYENAAVYESAKIFGSAMVSGCAIIYGSFWISGPAHICGNACIFGDGWISENIEIDSGVWDTSLRVGPRKYMVSTTLKKI